MYRAVPDSLDSASMGLEGGHAPASLYSWGTTGARLSGGTLRPYSRPHKVCTVISCSSAQFPDPSRSPDSSAFIACSRLTSNASANFSPAFLNRKLKRVAEQVFGDRVPHPKSDYFKNLSLYDFGHSGAVHLRLLAKDNPGQISLDAIRHRAGWADFNMLNYYTQFIGLDGKIERQGMLLKQDRHKIEKDLEEEKKKRLALERKLQSLAKRFEAVLPMIEES